MQRVFAAQQAKKRGLCSVDKHRPHPKTGGSPQDTTYNHLPPLNTVGLFDQPDIVKEHCTCSAGL